jgi:hypothetical protein
MKELMIKEYRQTIETGKGKEIHSPLKVLESSIATPVLPIS